MIWLWGSLNPLRGGGCAGLGSTCCPGCVVADSVFGSSGWNTVPRLSFYGKLNFVNGKELVASAS